MNNVWRLFRFDLGRLKANVMSIIITLGLVLVPSLFAWYNIIACWNVFDNTGNLTVAVANTDEGYQSDLIPLRINIGDQVVSALRANDQIDWHITDEEDAIDGAKSGRYYAAVVIPKSFSRDMLTFYTGDAGHADIVYYANEKKSAIAPKITDQGADTVSYQVNAVFAQTLSEVSLSLAESLSSFADEDDWDGRIAVVADHVREMADAFDDASGVLSLYGSLARSCEDLSRHSARPGHPGLHGSGRDAVRRDGAGRRGAGHGGRSEELGGYAQELAGRQRRRLRGGIRFRRRTVRCGFRGQSGHCQGSARPGRCACVPCDGVPPGGRQLGRRRPVAAREPPAPSDRPGRPCESGGVPGGFHGREPADGRR